jgi:hypothetical protein
MTRPWQCPSCSRILAPHIDVCPCSEPPAGAALPLVPPTPLTPAPATTALPLTFGEPVSVSGETLGTTWEGVTITINAPHQERVTLRPVPDQARESLAV